MCGPSAGEKSAAAQQASFATQLQQDYGTRFAGQNAAIGNLSGILQGFQQGKLLPGFSPSTLAALNTQAINTTAGNYKNAQMAANNANAGRGGDSGLMPGTVGAENATIASNAAGQLSAQQQQIQLANQNEAEQNTKTAMGGYAQLAGIENPEAFGQEAGSNLSQSFNEQNQISQQENQVGADIAGGITGLASNFVLPGISGAINAAPGQSALSGALGAF